jgi:hypothetical protein
MEGVGVGLAADGVALVGVQVCVTDGLPRLRVRVELADAVGVTLADSDRDLVRE